MSDGAAFVGLSLSDETVRFRVSAANTLTMSIQWVLESGGGSATMVLYASPLQTPNVLLDELDPAVNRNWSETPMVWAELPGGGKSSYLLPMADVGVGTLLWEIVVTGTIVLTGYVYKLGSNS